MNEEETLALAQLKEVLEAERDDEIFLYEENDEFLLKYLRASEYWIINFFMDFMDIF